MMSYRDNDIDLITQVFRLLRQSWTPAWVLIGKHDTPTGFLTDECMLAQFGASGLVNIMDREGLQFSFFSLKRKSQVLFGASPYHAESDNKPTSAKSLVSRLDGMPAIPIRDEDHGQSLVWAAYLPTLSLSVALQVNEKYENDVEKNEKNKKTNLVCRLKA